MEPEAAAAAVGFILGILVTALVVALVIESERADFLREATDECEACCAPLLGEE